MKNSKRKTILSDLIKIFRSEGQQINTNGKNKFFFIDTMLYICNTLINDKSMNIFALDTDVKTASQYHVDKHIVKMPLETAQMLCTASWYCDLKAPYKPTHKKHPCNLWLLESLDNYIWLCNLGIELCKEYTYRYGRKHGCEKVILECYVNFPNLPSKGLTPHALAMPNDCKISNNSVECYRKYYNEYKQHLFSWTKRDKPFFIKTL